MLQQLSLDEFLELVTTSKRIAVYREIAADRLTPIGIVESLAVEMQDGTILESGLRREDAGRYSFITFGATAELSVRENKITQRVGSRVTYPTAHPFTALRQLISDMESTSKTQNVDFINGAVGFLTYDAIRLFENIPNQHLEDNSLPEMLFKFYKTTLMFDHLQQTLLICTTVEVDANPKKTYEAALDYIDLLMTKIMTSSNPLPIKNSVISASDAEVDLSDEEFMTLVERAKQYIIQGDAFQIVLSRRFIQRYSTTPLDVYRALRRVSPAPYMFYFPTENGVIVGASPEKLISVKNRIVEINPIAGTRKLSNDNQKELIENDLLSDKKELAEHMMLVDLARNDLGAVCKPGSVKPRELLKVKHFSHISHITSTITGELHENKDALEALASGFPAGTLSGAPKIRAMEIIDELETSRRGMYGGAICRLDFRGNLDSCIAIRMAVLKDGIATIRTGAGIVYDSNPQNEANETRQKARGVLEAIRSAEEDLL